MFQGLSAPEQYLEKLNYSIDFIKSKQDVIQSHMEKVQGKRDSYDYAIIALILYFLPNSFS